MRTDVRVEVFVFEGCPNVEATLERARRAIATANVAADLQLVHIGDDEQARRLRFLGSPTVRVDGADVDPTAATRGDFGMQCRIYLVDGRFERAPPVAWIAAALRGELPEEGSSSPARDCCARAAAGAESGSACPTYRRRGVRYP
jgi:hypothetical protein